ncbi:MAG: hypothetical protein GXP63_02815 [DPANN group archaeon]|nr:hypothetical protein [DPANN group archaeon]
MGGPRLLVHATFGVELVYALLLATLCFVIFWKTKELYRLSNHQGIGYFRLAFLFFGVAFGLRILIPLSTSMLGIWPGTIREVTSITIIFTGTVAVLYVLFSVIWKRLKMSPAGQHGLVILFALLISAATFLPTMRVFLFGLQIVIFTAATIISLLDHRRLPRKKQKGSWYLLYLMLFFSWLANLLAHFTLRISQGITYGLYVISAGLFVMILVRVFQRTKKH